MGRLVQVIGPPLVLGDEPRQGMLETIFPDYKKQKEASLTASQALQNLANIAALSGSKLAKGLAGIFGGASGVSAGLSSLKSMSG